MFAAHAQFMIDPAGCLLNLSLALPCLPCVSGRGMVVIVKENTIMEIENVWLERAVQQRASIREVSSLVVVVGKFLDINISISPFITFSKSRQV
ncbi:hypothetical protein F5Y17DRAFT_371525 [Xylariaceae sp. FL0594]|nr:hypothetical protein F5Y17DRAFT_371525 [Xylariaceae sp. FL0594]